MYTKKQSAWTSIVLNSGALPLATLKDCSSASEVPSLLALDVSAAFPRRFARASLRRPRFSLLIGQAAEGRPIMHMVSHSLPRTQYGRSRTQAPQIYRPKCTRKHISPE